MNAYQSKWFTNRYGVDKVSESTMHRLLKDEIKVADFECISPDDYQRFVDKIEGIKKADLLDTVKLKLAKCALPESYRQTRIVKCSYEALRNIYHARKHHRLTEWFDFCTSLEQLPYSEFITDENHEEFYD